ncbi:hypothetical protein L1887_15531 [Cichorium endivia]|nr:hypothetical protein L1887_15531 [Cichorium endivia]
MNSTVAPVSDSSGFLRSENNGRGAEGMQSPTNPTQPITWGEIRSDSYWTSPIPTPLSTPLAEVVPFTSKRN